MRERVLTCHTSLTRLARRRLCLVTSSTGTAEYMRGMTKRYGARCPLVVGCAYAMSKLAANARFREEEPGWRERGATAVAIQPGYVRTEMNRGKGMLTPEESARGVKRVCDGLLPHDAGKFLDWERKELAW